MISAKSIYIHIPFCKTKCPYCDFASWANKEDLIEQYFQALIDEINTKCEAYSNYRGENRSIKTIYFGGGTPSLISPVYYEKIFNELRKYFVIEDNCEITLELNPGTARKDYLLGYKQLGINRISIGAQSFNETILEVLGRKHSIKDTEFAIDLVKDCGFTNLNLDLIYGVPGITKEIWKHTLAKSISFEPKHISAYSLIIEPNTPFEKIYEEPASLPSDDFTFELYEILCQCLSNKGYIHYEISNFAKPNYQSRHNLVYWLGMEYFAFGVSAHRYIDGMRTNNTNKLEEYIKSPNIETIQEFPLDSNFETLMLNSRLKDGISVELLKKSCLEKKKNINYIIKELENEELIEINGNSISLTDKGMFLNNEIILKLT